MTRPLKVGDPVAYTAEYLRNTGQVVGSAGQRRGEVLGFVNDNLVIVRWRGEDEGMPVARKNVCRPGLNLDFCAG